MKKIMIILATMSIVTLLCFSLVACSTTSFGSITGVKNFTDIEKIEIANNSNIVDGHISGSMVRQFTEEKDILAIYNILNSAKYSKVEADNSEPSDYEVRIYVKGKAGYISYSWDKMFEGKASYNGKVNEGNYSMLDADIYEKELVKIFYQA